MSALAARLRELRTQSGQPSAVTPSTPAFSSGVLRLIQGRSRIQGVAQRAPSSDRMVPGVEIASGLFLTEAIVDWGRPPMLIDTAFARWEEPVAHSRLLHFDTETTGLAGGTGTRAWMIGAADWLADGRFRLRQLTTTTMGAETAMLRTFAQWLQPDTVLVPVDAPQHSTTVAFAVGERRQDGGVHGLRRAEEPTPTAARGVDLNPRQVHQAPPNRAIGSCPTVERTMASPFGTRTWSWATLRQPYSRSMGSKLTGSS